MHRIDTDGAVAGLFTDNGPGASTVVDDDWANGVQESLCQFIEAAGITLVKGTHTQLTAAVAAYIATHNAVTNPHSATAAATASRLVLRDAAGRAAVANPSAAGDIATKGYVDGTVGEFAAATGWDMTDTAILLRIRVVAMQIKATYSAGGSTLVATLPAGFRPEFPVFAIGLQENAGVKKMVLFEIATTGAVSVTYRDDGTGTMVATTPAANDVVRLAVSFGVPAGL